MAGKVGQKNLYFIIQKTTLLETATILRKVLELHGKGGNSKEPSVMGYDSLP